jgi:hypothetical protein
MMTLRVAVIIRDPPLAPATISTFPLCSTIVGTLDDSGLFPGSVPDSDALALADPSSVELKTYD